MEPVQHRTAETNGTTATTETIEIEGDANNLGEIDIIVKTDKQTNDNRETVEDKSKGKEKKGGGKGQGQAQDRRHKGGGRNGKDKGRGRR